MPAQFPEIWLKRVIRNISQAIVAAFLDGIPDLDVNVTELGEGSASETNIIHLTSTQFKPDVLINNTTYPIALQAYNDEGSTIALNKFQTKVTTVTDDQIIGANYDKIDIATRTHTEAIAEKKYMMAIHALAPQSNTANTPVVTTNGASDGTRKRLVYADIVALKDKFDKMQAPLTGRRLVLCSDHYNDLLLDRDRFADLLVKHDSGNPTPVIAGFEIYQYIANPTYTAGVKDAFGSVPGAGSYQASVAFVRDNVAKKTGLTKQYFAPSKNDPENQMNKLNYRHYFIAVPFQNKFMGAIASGV
jgi:hypothetical protein